MSALARRRALLAIGAPVLVAVVLGTTLALRSSGGSMGACGTPPSGFKERSVWNMSFGLRTIVLTNFRFGSQADPTGLTSFAHWPASAVTVEFDGAVTDTLPRFRPALHVGAADFETAYEQTPSPLAYIATRRDGRVQTATVEVGAVTPATIAGANRALSFVQGCSV